MDQKKIIIKLSKNGTIFAETKGMTGKACIEYMEFFKSIPGVNILDSAYTKEYYQNEEEMFDHSEILMRNNF